jgi:hypothetical protein
MDRKAVSALLILALFLVYLPTCVLGENGVVTSDGVNGNGDNGEDVVGGALEPSFYGLNILLIIGIAAVTLFSGKSLGKSLQRY